MSDIVVKLQQSNEIKEIVNQVADELKSKSAVNIEITMTNECNGNCSYCFEHNHSKSLIDENEQNRQLKLIVDYCNNFDKNKFSGLNIVFWGGEPMLNFEFMKRIFDQTLAFDFIRYFIYSNGTRFDKYFEMVHLPYADELRERFSIQLSYDGEPHNRLKRGNTREIILRTAHMLKDNGFDVRFKATLSYDMIRFLPEIWKSYEKLNDEFGELEYSPTLDTTISEMPEENFQEWKHSLEEIAKLEFDFYRKNNRFLMSWFNTDGQDNKLVCNIDYNINIHLDGNIYPCHGCSYSCNNKDFIIGNTKQIESLADVLCKQVEKYNRPRECEICGAVFCNICHVAEVRPLAFKDDWVKCMTNNKLRCKYFKYFGKIKTMLDLAIIDTIDLKPEITKDGCLF